MHQQHWTRRDFLRASATTAVLAGLTRGSLRAAEKSQSPRTYCVFVKYLQTLSFDELADRVAEMGFQGIEATVRRKGQIEPEQAADRLPELVDALRARNLDISVMTSSINRADDRWTEPVLRTAAQLGVKQYRMDYYKYDLKQPVADQLASYAPMVRELAALNREIGIRAVYQNHAGPQYVGSTLWDLHWLLKDIPREEIGSAFDIRHAVMEAGLSWPVLFNLMQSHLAAVFVKDAAWQGRELKQFPVGEGAVPPQFYQQLRKSDFNGPISLHVEYLPQGSPAENLAAIRRDFASLKRLMNDG